MEPEDKHDRFVEWAKRKGVLINGVQPAHIENRGIGIVASREIKVKRIAQTGLSAPLIQNAER